MLRIFYVKWFLCGFLIIQQIYATETQNQEPTDKDTQESIDWTGLLADLRGNWQSPLSYLEKRGYLPAGNENLLEEKLNELRGMKNEDTGENVGEEGGDETRLSAASSNKMPETDELSGRPQIASEITDTSVSNLAGSDARNPIASLRANNNQRSIANLMFAKNEPHAQYQTNTNDEEPLVTYASRQQLTNDLNDLQDDLYMGLSEDLNADVDRETEQETDEADADSYENQIADIKSAIAAQTQGRSNKKKCKSKSKSKGKTSKAKAGFFQNLKQKFSAMFRKSDKVAETKKTVQNKKQFALSPNFASYYVKYLAHKDASHDLSINDATGEYTSVRYYGDLEMGDGGKGLYRRDYSGKDLTLRDYKNEDTAASGANEKNEESNGLEGEKTLETGSKDLALREFPFKDFNLGDIDMKKLQANELKSDSNEHVKVADMKNFDSKDEEVNAIVHSLAEQETKGKALTPTKATDDEAANENVNLGAKDFSLKKYTPTFEGTQIAPVGKNVERAAITKDLNTKADYLGDFETPIINAKDYQSASNSYGDLVKRINLKDFDFTLPDLGLKGLATKSNQYIASTKKFGNLGMPSSKIKALEDDAAATTSLQNAKDANESSLDASTSGAEDKENDDDSNSAEDEDDDAEERSHVAVKQRSSVDFDLHSLSTTADDNNLEWDRQFTKEVLEKVMRDANQINAAVKA